MPVVYVTLLCLVLLSWVVVVFLHELGHAVMARLMGAPSAEIYVGSYGDAESSWRLPLPGRLTLWFRPRLVLTGGLCRARWRPEAPPGRARQVAFILAGPVTSTLIAVALLWPAFQAGAHGALKLVLVVFGCMSVIDLVVNLLPLQRQVPLDQGGTAYSDGYQLYRLAASAWFNVPTDEERLQSAADMFNKGDYRGAAGPLCRLLAQYPDSSIYQLAFSAYYNSQQFDQALQLADKYPGLEASFDDHATLRAYLLARTEQLPQAEALYTELLVSQPVEQHPLLRNNRGYCYLLAGRYPEAQRDFDAVLAQEPENAYALAQRGRVRLELGDASGLADLHRAQELNPAEAFAWCNLGLHAHAAGRYAEALGYLQQAQALDPHLHRLPAYLAAAQGQLQASVEA
ncbi:hypothetical protein GCM10023185_46730 [Hymenobacter saemangeumensis]|uniref:Tetratricopeptide repeat protein n=2 Tax=Hymenobacter saemangeumensis TaxID=1084522 RepID=A0ABP8ISY5_9BACT